MFAMKAYQIIILIALLVLFVVFSILLYVFSQAVFFRRRLKKREYSMGVLFSEKKEVLLLLDKLYREKGMVYEESDEALREKLMGISLAKCTQKEIKAARDSLKDVQSRLFFLASNNRWIQLEKEYEDLRESSSDLDVNYRQSSALYNADVNAYNYWVNIPFIHTILWIVGFRNKPILN